MITPKRHTPTPLIFLKAATGLLISVLLHTSVHAESTHKTSDNRARKAIAYPFLRLTQTLDRFFSNSDSYKENKSYLYASTGPRWNNTSDLTMQSRLRAKIHLPQTQNKINLLIDSWVQEDEELGDNRENEQIKNDESYQSALQVLTDVIPKWRERFDIGVRVRSRQISPFIRTSLSNKGLLAYNWQWSISTRLFYFDHNGFGASFSTEFDKPLTREHFVSYEITTRFQDINNETSVLSQGKYDIVHSSSWVSTVSIGTVFTYAPQLNHRRHFLEWALKYRLYENWVFLELAPRIDFPEDDDFDGDESITLRLEAFIY